MPSPPNWPSEPAAKRPASPPPAETTAILPRNDDLIPVVTTSPFSVATMAWQLRPPQDSLTVIVKGTFDLVPGGRARPREESDLATGDLHVDGDPNKSLIYASDFAVIKPKADVTLTGHARPRGGSATAMQVIFRFNAEQGGFERAIVAIGDRRWQRKLLDVAPTDPEPFSAMPLVHERAFGGPLVDANPLGVGHKAEPGLDGITRLPNLELAGRLIMSPGDSPPPAAVGPIPPLWKQRWSRLGTYGDRWFRTRWPYFPEDFDPAFFQAAPEEQQVPHLRGDEPFELVGVHAELPTLAGRLPGLRARCFAKRTAAAGGGFGEIPLRLDTAAFDADAMAVNLVWRGLLEVSDDDAPEIEHLFVMHEELDAAPAAVEEAHARYLAALRAAEVVAETPGEQAAAANDAAPPAQGADDHAPAGDTAPGNAAARGADPSEEQEPPDVEKAIEARQAELLQKLRAEGIPEEELTGTPPPVPPPPSPEAIAEQLRESGAEEDDIAALLKALGPQPEEAEEDNGEAKPAAAEGRARAVALLEAGMPLDDHDFAGADLSGLDFSGRSLVRAHLRDTNLRGAVLAKATLTEAQLGGADLTGAVLAGADLTSADFTGAVLEKAQLDGATLEATRFDEARGPEASFAGARGRAASFTSGTWDGASFAGMHVEDADFTRAAIAGADFRGATLPEVRLYEARGSQAVFDGATMTGARGDGAALPRSSFKAAVLPGSVWEIAVLDEATFDGADLKDASFRRAICRKARFVAADLREAQLVRARLAGAVFLEANLMMASLEKADLTLADLRGANLHAAGLVKATLEHAQLEGALLTQSSIAQQRQP
ncbi:uncharacterized protein SOCE26_058100 [Sorangium cellulosum]|uniref:DUF2169 domain-containing protein n=1 Tax=Sorangium cellulosum TaxID=56 RepID=A0A2L0EYH6_SORCE|nr:DUF2169 domain-containing protein [Sorangium cellulosum]AUX44346.1 uncharacterized protein SOCE26_058100 [Sorangium cellulosum]